MPMSLADARYHLRRLTGLIRRALASLRTRGWKATLHRIGVHTRRQPAARRVPLFMPAAKDFAAFSVPASAQPVVSIVIPVYNHCPATLACLRALAAHPPATACEVIVVDDGSSDDTAAWMAQVDGLRYHRRAANGGFIAACNDGAAQARGQFLVFLNNDTLPQPGWLDALLATFNAARNPRWPDAPTLRELGYPQAVYTSPWGLAAPAGTPAAVVQKLHDAFHKAMLSPRHTEALARYDQSLDYLNTRDYRQAVLTTVEREKKLLARMNLLAPPKT